MNHRLRLSARSLAILLFPALLWAPGSPAQPREPATPDSGDLILINGRIITVDSKDAVVEALAIHDGKIVALGTSQEIRARAPKGAKVIDLRGHAATPGLIDAHCHFDATSAIYQLDFSKAKKISEIVEMVRQRVAERKPGEWVLGQGWDESKLAELRYVVASDLDQAAPANPVWLMHTTGHYGVANSYAMRLAKITPLTKDPEGGTIDRDAAGRPSGVLKELAMERMTALVPPYTHDQERAGVLKMMADFNKEGMTAAKDPGIWRERWELYQELLRENRFTVRILALLDGGRTMESARAVLASLETQPKPPESLGRGMLLSGGVKLYMDGSGGGRTAWVYDPWFKKATEVDPGNTGYPNIDPPVYRQMVKMFHDSGVHVSTHAVGDRAIDWVVDTYAAVLKEKPTKGLRHGIIHCNIPTDHAIATMAELERDYDAGYPETQAPFLWWLGDTYAGTFGAKRDLRLMPYKTYTEKHIRWAGGSDYFVTPYPARYGLWASVVRETLNGVYGAKPFGTAESVDIHTALRSYTIWAAHQLFLDDQIGSLEPGKDADIAVWDRDPYTVASGELKNLKCELTFLRGRMVYRAADTAIPVPSGN